MKHFIKELFMLDNYWPISYRFLNKDMGDKLMYRIEIQIGWRSIPITGFWFTNLKY